MSAQKRHLDQPSSTHKSKKIKLSPEDKAGKSKRHQVTESSLTSVLNGVDFPRGGGTTFTPVEVKALREEAAKEADRELFQEAQTEERRKKKKRTSENNDLAEITSGKTNGIRVEHLNYKRMTVGMKILGQVISVQPLALVVSLPNQLLGHVPISQISTQFTNLLEAMEGDEEKSVTEEGEDDLKGIPDLTDLFHAGQYIRAVVTAVHEHGSTDMAEIGRTRDEVVKASRRVELSLAPEKINAEVQKSDLRNGFTLTAAVKSIEDHGYLLELGIPDVSGFLKFEGEATPGDERLYVGQVVDVVVEKMASNRRTCNVVINPGLFANSALSEVANITSILPGMLVQSLVTAVSPAGLTLQVLGFFDGTVDQFHIHSGPPEKFYKVGRKVKARVLYKVSSDPPRFALSLANHVVGLIPRSIKAEGKTITSTPLQEAYPVGMILDAVKVTRVETERGLVVEVQPQLEGYVHISHVSDEHTPSLPATSGSWKISTTHKTRVIGYHPFDGLLQLSLRPSVLGQKYLQAEDLQVGEIVQGTIKRLNESGLIVAISGNLSGIVWPNHYAEIVLKHPQKRFKVGGKIKCRVLALDVDRKHITLTAKKSLVESDLPIISSFQNATVGLVTIGVIMKVFEKYLVVEFYNKTKATVPRKEARETESGNLTDTCVIGKAVKVRIISTDSENLRIKASIRQALPDFKSPASDVSGIEIGNIVGGVVTEIHKDNAVLTLHATGARALISLRNVANHRECSVLQLHDSIKPGDEFHELVVVTRNPEKGLVIVANKPKPKGVLPKKSTLSMDNLAVGQIVGGRVTSHTRNGAFVKLSSHLGGTLHPTDRSDNYEAGMPFPDINSVLKAVIIDVDGDKKTIALSTRNSRMYPAKGLPIADREIKSLSDLRNGDTVRGFVKSVTEHGLFVYLGRDIDARVQIRELFDEYVKDWQARFKTNQLIKGRVLDVNVEKQKVELSFRSGDLSRDSASPGLASFREGQIINGRVKKVEGYGLFIEIEGSKLSGLCHKSQLSDNKDADVTIALRTFREGDKIRAMVLSIDTVKRRISFCLKPSCFLADAAAESQSEAEEGEEGDEDENLYSSEPTSAGLELVSADGDEDKDEAAQIDMEPQTHFFAPTTPRALPLPMVLKIEGGFQWSGGVHPLEEEEQSDLSSDEDDEDPSDKRKKRRRKEIEQDLTATMHSKTPESTADFERLLLGSPNSSYLWVQYMSFQLQLSEVEKAREIGRRALETIDFREEQEKLNIWTALLNLENAFGTDDSLEQSFKNAANRNDSKTIYLRLANIFDQSQKYDKAEDQYKRTCKKFSQSSKVWTLFAEYYLRRSQLDDARNLLPRSLQSLEKRKHLKTISKFAQLEYKLGDPERGKTIFEGIVDSHPKRWDLWSVYMDMEVGQQDIQNLRNLFDRVLALKMTSHKAKFFFKKWLDLERKFGDEAGATAVKLKAIEWTQKAANSS